MLRPLLILLLMIAGTARADEVPASAKSPLRVLLLVPGDLLMPWAVIQSETTKSAILAAVPGRIEFFAEGLDGLRFPGSYNEDQFVSLLLKRYSAVPPDLIVVHGPMEGFVERQRGALWPNTPLMAVGKIAGALSTSNYPDGVPGTSVSFDSAGTVDLALHLLPDAKRIVVVGGSSEYSRAEIQQATDQLERFRGRLEIQYLIDLPMEEMQRRLAALPRDTILLQLPIFRDGTGEIRVPRDLAAQLAAAANTPTFAYYDSAFGYGLTGGAIANWGGQKDMVGRIARELLLGRPRKESLLMHPPVPSVCVVDWRQMKHWNLAIDRLPKDCEVRYREPTLWEQFHRELLIILGVLLIQSVLIIALVVQRQRRHRAELELHHQRAQLAHAVRLATVGELSASIAHEINQPLAAILSNAEAGETLIKTGKARMEDLHEILTAIREDDARAGEVIQRLRKLLRSEAGELRPLNLNETVESIVRLTRGIATSSGVSVHAALDPGIPLVRGDSVQLQQVLLNLIVNAIEAVHGSPSERRRVTISTTERPLGSVEVTVSDGGPGVDIEKLSRIFEPFFTTKCDGMGLGLSITRSIVNAHRGRIWAESDTNGATFRFILPV